ncbi:hypothetical protein DFH08DRAFT_953408 [Mycena albidolilacea]|uniref:Uncharacterized protein n=1 Tax=Mycena albidolilacea TaxID=1033008 RepID=A0AAD7EZC3_9AGAR|nr:hypothetical protein DFH08DRAFT_953408 [Mycena albidolilacea]
MLRRTFAPQHTNDVEAATARNTAHVSRKPLRRTTFCNCPPLKAQIVRVALPVPAAPVPVIPRLHTLRDSKILVSLANRYDAQDAHTVLALAAVPSLHELTVDVDPPIFPCLSICAALRIPSASPLSPAPVPYAFATTRPARLSREAPSRRAPPHLRVLHVISGTQSPQDSTTALDLLSLGHGMPRDDLLAVPVATPPQIAPSLHELTLHVDPRANAPRAIRVSSGPLRLASFPRLRARHLRDVIIGARHPPGDLKILVPLRASLIPQGASAALHTLALDVAYITDDNEPPDAHPALVLAVVPSLYMLHAELAFRSGDAANDPCFLCRAVHLCDAYDAGSAMAITRSSPLIGAFLARPSPCSACFPRLCAWHHTPPSFLPRGRAASSSLKEPFLDPSTLRPTSSPSQAGCSRPCTRTRTQSPIRAAVPHTFLPPRRLPPVVSPPSSLALSPPSFISTLCASGDCKIIVLLSVARPTRRHRLALDVMYLADDSDTPDILPALVPTAAASLQVLSVHLVRVLMSLDAPAAANANLRVPHLRIGYKALIGGPRMARRVLPPLPPPPTPRRDVPHDRGVRPRFGATAEEGDALHLHHHPQHPHPHPCFRTFAFTGYKRLARPHANNILNVYDSITSV